MEMTKIIVFVYFIAIYFIFGKQYLSLVFAESFMMNYFLMLLEIFMENVSLVLELFYSFFMPI